MQDGQSVCTRCLINKPAKHSPTLVTTELIEVNKQKTSGEKKGLTFWRRWRVQKDAMKDERQGRGDRERERD